MLNFIKANKWNLVIMAFVIVIAINLAGYIKQHGPILPIPLQVSNRGRTFRELSVEYTDVKSSMIEDENEMKYHLQDIKTGERFWTYDLNGDGALYPE